LTVLGAYSVAKLRKLLAICEKMGADITGSFFALAIILVPEYIYLASSSLLFTALRSS